MALRQRVRVPTGEPKVRHRSRGPHRRVQGHLVAETGPIRLQERETGGALVPVREAVRNEQVRGR